MNQADDNKKNGGSGRYMNHLANEKSPYLRLHAANPVDWYPWGEEAFSKAKQENKPVFLSIGYSTCHWCHVMEDESFKDPDVAKLLNDSFISIKVDREERPDIDSIYMKMAYILNKSGGWPLTIFLTPEKDPFYAATYIPKNTRFGRMGLLELLPDIIQAWEKENDKIRVMAKKYTKYLIAFESERNTKDINIPLLLENAYSAFEFTFDPDYGGFGVSPKFPSPVTLLFLLQYWKKTGNQAGLDMVEKTLQEISAGGIHDHIGYGFHRYATDRKWKLPHFEKMLYDQALLALVFIEAFQATGKVIYKTMAENTLAYVEENMISPEGGFYSAEDADSEGEEGKYYLWSKEELKKILTPPDFELFKKIYPVHVDGNFKEESTGQKTGLNILYRASPLKEIDLNLASLQSNFNEVEDSMDISAEELGIRLEKIRVKLKSVREQRIHPLKDTKILTDWNGLVIVAFSKAARIFHNRKYKEIAEKAASFILQNCLTNTGSLLHRYMEGEAGITGFAEDYAFFIWGLLELYETTFTTLYLRAAIDLQDYFIDNFWESGKGGFLTAPAGQEDLIVRQVDTTDLALPSANSVSIRNLIRLSRMTGNSTYEDYSETLIRVIGAQAEKGPAAYSFYLSALFFTQGPAFEIIITGPAESPDTLKMIDVINSLYLPWKIVLLHDPGSSISNLGTIVPFIKNYPLIENKTAVYICENFVCQLPVTDPQTLIEHLRPAIKSR